MKCEDPTNIAQKESKDKMIKIIKENPWQKQTPASRWLGYKPKHEDVQRSTFNKAYAKFLMKRQCTCWDSGAQGFILTSAMRTKALLKQIHKSSACTIHIWQHSEKCGTSLWLCTDYPEPSHTWNDAPRNRPTDQDSSCLPALGLCSALLPSSNTSGSSCVHTATFL